MSYSKIQKVVSSFLLFIFFTGQIFGLSFFNLFSNLAYAQNTKFYDIISIIVNEEVYNELENEIKRYAEDIQRNLENTKAIILPIKIDTPAFSIASMNERLFYEGYRGLKDVAFESRLIGTILIGPFDLPIVGDSGKTTKSIVPFTDFIDKRFIYNPETKIFEKNNENLDGLKVEIFHGVISPNSGNKQTDIEKIRNFLDKNHDFYTGKNLFDKNKGVLNGKIGEEISENHKPYVFYFDGIREQKSINYSAFKGYQAFLENKEDIIYNRYSKSLAEKIKNKVLGAQNSELENLIGNIDSNEIKNAFKNLKGPDLDKTTDIMSKQVIDGVTNNFLEIFNKGSISNFRTNVHNAGRYNSGTSDVNVDLIPYFITILDLVSDKVIKSANTDLEEKIDELVKSSLSRKIAIPKKIYTYNTYSYTDGDSEDTTTNYKTCKSRHLNFLSGRQISKVNLVKDCSIFRGSTYNGGTLVEANRGFNFNLIEGDTKLCHGKNPKGHYGGSSPLNLDFSNISSPLDFNLKSYDLDSAIFPVFDIKGSKRSNNPLNNPSPLNCLENNFLTIYKESFQNNGNDTYSCNTSYSVPINGQSNINWDCGSVNRKIGFNHNFISDYKSIRTGRCGGKTIKYNNKVFTHINHINRTIDGGITTCVDEIEKVIYYKFIPSYLEHKSPTIEELNKQLKSKITPNLGINKDRYIDFISAIGNHKKIKYPFLFRLSGSSKQEVESALKQYLTKKSIAINAIIASENPNTLSGKDLEIYNILKVGNYNSSNFDLVSFLKNKPIKTLNISGEEKEISYFDFLVFSIYWNSLTNISAKYKFVFENYLSDQIGGNEFNFILPKHKKQYEIAFLGAHGNAQNMFIKIDPEKALDRNPFSNIISKNNLLNNNKLSIGILAGSNRIGTSNKASFKCAPPEGVPIWEWLPAIKCWLDGLLPAKISIGEGQCGSSQIFESQEEYKQFQIEKYTCSNDFNKNGVNDCVENRLKNNGKLELSSDNKRYSLNKRGILKTEILDKTGKRILLDNSSHVSFDLNKIIDYKTKQVVFDSSKHNFYDKIDIINRYIYFKPFSIRSSYGSTKYSFSTKNKEADIYFKASLNLQDASGEKVLGIKSNDLIVKIRSERLFLGITKLGNNKERLFGNDTIVNSETNIYLYDKKNTHLDTSTKNANSLIFGITNLGKDSLKRNISFPIKIIIKDRVGTTILEETINNLNQVKDLYNISKSGRYTIKIVDKYGNNTSSKFDVLSGAPEELRIDLGTTVLEPNGSISVNLISIYDKYDNIVSGDIYDFEINIMGDSLIFNQNKNKKLTLSTFEGFKAFRLKSTSIKGISRLQVDLYKADTKLLSSSKNIRVIDNIEIDLKFSDTLKVGNNRYKALVEFKDNNGRLLSELNSRVYLNVGKEYIEPKEAFSSIINGKAEIEFSTKTLAGKNIPFNLRVEGFTSNISEFITILPGKPASLLLVPTKTKLEASTQSETFINVELKDFYRNTVFTDNSSIINLEILDKYTDIITASSKQSKLNKGKTRFKINATKLPGSAYVKFSINKNLEENEFIVSDADNKLVIKGVSENVILLETFFFFNKESIYGNKYNALYTILLGANYGDITQKNYLAGAMLFDRYNRSLAVTSLLNNPYNYKDGITILSNGTINKVFDSSDLSQDINFSLKKDINGIYYINLFNDALNIHIGKIYLNFDNLNIDKKFLENIQNKKTINLKEILEIQNFDIFSTTSKVRLNHFLDTKKNSIIVYIKSNSYFSRNSYSIKGSSLTISYKDPFSTEYSLNSFSRDSSYTYDNFKKNGNLGWGAGNKSLLNFASGKNVGESTKDYMGVSTINLGDPIVSLKKIKEKSHGIYKKFDSTIGKKLNSRDILGYKTFDYNADSRDDILLIEKSGFLSLLENKKTGTKFLDQKNLVRVIDFGNIDNINSGDFSGDKFEDIFFVNNKGNPYLLNNTNKDFVRVNLTKNFDLKGSIIHARSFDMDNDGITDIITLDDFGEINIFYGKKDSINFDKKTIFSGYAIELSGEKRNDLGAIYFDGLLQDSLKKEKTDYKDVFPSHLLENIIFESIAFDKNIDPLKENHTKKTKFIRSEFAGEVGLEVSKVFVDKNLGKLNSGDIVEVTLRIKNTSSKEKNNIVYLEDIPKYFVLDLKSIKTSRDVIVRKSKLANYNFYIDKFSLLPSHELKITYNLKTRALSYGNIKVGLFEKDEIGDDKYGDILITQSKYNCGGNSDIFRSIETRIYEKGIKKENCDKSILPYELKKNDIDENNNQIPDHIDDLKNATPEELKQYSKKALERINQSNKIPEDINILDNLENLNNNVDIISSKVDNLIQGFGCGFGGGSCFSMPVNWAPLAPGNDPVVMGRLVGDGLKVDEGIPVFSALTGINIPTPGGCFQIPAVWPISPFKFTGSCNTDIQAGGYLGVDSPTNFFRLFVSPTLTGGVGTAACFGGPASVAGNIPPKGVNPVVPGGNCIVVAAPLPNLCGNEEINSDPGSIGQVNYFGGAVNLSGNFGVINGNCSVGTRHKKLPITNKINTSLARQFLNYRKTGIVSSSLSEEFKKAFSNPARAGDIGNNRQLTNRPLLSINSENMEDSDISIDLNLDGKDSGITFKGVEQLSQNRVAAFPGFITNWVTAQLEEFITKLTSFPTLFIILPDFSSIFNTDLEEYAKYLKEGTTNSSGIKEAYEFLGNVPFVTIVGEQINISIPWIDEASLNATLAQWKMSVESYEQEIKAAIDSWTYGEGCQTDAGSDIGIKCDPENQWKQKAILDMHNFTSSLNKNIQVLQSYKEIPSDLAELSSKKQDYLEQVLCNIETIGEVTSGWLDRNGKRFKSWVELYILIKAILKSWQLLADIFIDYEAECHECKNERNNSIGAQFNLVSMIIPKIPVIKFPKWPDIVLDLHNIRMNLEVVLPQFNFTKRPLILPPAPTLTLPTSPGISFQLPSLVILPLIEIPKLPDLPSLPTIKLPDLPPPPRLPKLWPEIEGVLNILKLVTKAMCILKKSPFVPESRAGDQIAFLTESSGYRPFDFIDLTMPQFSYPFVDEIKVTSFVNLEFDSNFIVEMAKTIANPINAKSNNFINMFNTVEIQDINLGDSGLDDVNLNNEIGFKGKDLISTKEFINLVNKEFSKESIINNPKFNELRKSFDIVNNYTFSREDKLIANLKKAHYEKFDILKSIIKKEIREQKNFKKEIFNKNKYQIISNNKVDKIKLYNASLNKYNEAFKASALNLVNPSYFNTQRLKESGKEITKSIKNTTDNYKKYFALSNTSSNISGGNNCKANTSKYKRNYKGIYIIQEENNKKINYRLFDYLDSLSGREVITEIDFDLDGDSDILYSMNNNLYLKENLINNPDRDHVSGVEILEKNDNKFVNGERFYEAINGARESFIGNEFLNINFLSSNREYISKYRLEYYSIIDKYLNKGNISYSPKNIRKNIVDGFVSTDKNTIIEKKDGIIKRKNKAYIYTLGNNIPKIQLKTKKLLNIKYSLKAGKIATISNGTRIYAGNRSVKIYFIKSNNKEVSVLKIDAHTNIELSQGIKVIKISGDAYTISNKDIILNGSEIYSYLGLPLSFNAEITRTGEFNHTSSSHIGIKYFDGTKVDLNFRNIESYKLYNLGFKSNNYSITLNIDNDYLYARLQTISNGVFGTKTSQILLSPQKEADQSPPEIDFNKKIRIPVYQEKIIDLTNYIYEDSGIDGISNISIDGLDTSKFNILNTGNKIRIKFGEFTTLFRKKIVLTLTDSNGNSASKNIDFEVYSPIPQISSYYKYIVSGNIDEKLTGIPINLYRVRGGSIKKLERISGETKVNTSKGVFNFDIKNINSDLIDVKINNNKIFEINENTGKINLTTNLYEIKALINPDNFVEVNVINNSNKKVFSQIIKLKSGDINIVNDFSSIEKEGLYFKFTSSDFDFYKLPSSVKYNPGSLAIYRKTDTKKEALFAILKDGRIKTVNDFYSIKYTTFNDYIVIKFIDNHFDREIGQLLFKIDSSYVIK